LLWNWFWFWNKKLTIKNSFEVLNLNILNSFHNKIIEMEAAEVKSNSGSKHSSHGTLSVGDVDDDIEDSDDDDEESDSSDSEESEETIDTQIYFKAAELPVKEKKVDKLFIRRPKGAIN
jgi:hypothetical protein